jgi:hypothetical protein
VKIPSKINKNYIKQKENYINKEKVNNVEIQFDCSFLTLKFFAEKFLLKILRLEKTPYVFK